MTLENTKIVVTESRDIRSKIVDALRLDLVGPWPGHEYEHERLHPKERPSRWYLTGFLIPSGTPPEQASDIDEDDPLDIVLETA
ncbi:hypothetical protein K8T06_01595, partial [bacterium]|nr:hypothetical protein [bacterium]